ncbi:regulatory LuxR family protein [Herbihabitans rhizosphaerae]|uniref:Regulatory LuxR family protein n=1 Tax=Herbihabitans rhizosphaerae TaxID=1872711 RepID=A0A4Q7L6Y4_9PSEU|nr:LuxR C-terminal-related transcriptional regulator [Herbihabitans rhizosphaerae]RZS44630.1 regulatory LuxR family protein [Herbihabitans rhizosphaerae]
MVSRLDVYWSIRGGFSEAVLWTERALAELPPDAPERLSAVVAEGLCAVYQDKIDFVRRQLDAHEELRATVAQPLFDAYFALIRGLADQFSRDEASARDLFAQALTSFREISHQPGAYYAAIVHGVATGMAGDYETGRKLLREAIAASESIGEVFWRSSGLCFLAMIEALDGNARAATEPARTALRLKQQVEDRFGEAVAVSALIAAALHDQDFVRAATLIGVSDVLWGGVAMDPVRTGQFGVLRRRYIDAIEAALSPSRTQALVADGRAMPRARWLPLALGEADPNPLTPRETEIAELVAKGLRNREIASKLVISLRTAETHVDRILNKLGLHSRTQVVTWMAEHHPTEPD